MNSDLIKTVKREYISKFEVEPGLIICAPGRINLLGEHTDYNEGYVLPGAIDRAIYIALGTRPGSKSLVHALDLDDHIEFETSSPLRAEKGWGNYVQGVVDQLLKRGMAFESFQAVFSGDIPIGSGLSSSAALECGFGSGIDQLFSLDLPKLEIAKMAQSAEHEFAGVKCGIMDQFASVFGKENSVMKIDCRTLEYTLHMLELGDYELVLINSMVHHELASSGYNSRRQECDIALRCLKATNNRIASLRDATLQDLEKVRVDDTVRKRAKYVIEENSRVLNMVSALSSADLAEVGKLMYATHSGLSADYEVSCEELDFLVELTKSEPAVLGARMMGGGFGGCTINLVRSPEVGRITGEILKKYQSKYGLTAEVYHVKLSEGVHTVEANNG